MWGDREEGLLAVEQETGETPNALLNKPRLEPWLAWYYDAFWVCDPGRAIHQGSIGRIPLSEYAAWIEIFEVVGIEARALFIRTMRALDSVYVGRINSRVTQDIERSKRDAEREAERNGR